MVQVEVLTRDLCPAYLAIQSVGISSQPGGLLPSSGQTLAQAESEARHYNHPATAPPPPQQLFLLPISQPLLNGLS